MRRGRLSGAECLRRLTIDGYHGLGVLMPGSLDRGRLAGRETV